MPQKTLPALTERLDDLGIPYAVIGGMALTVHGYARMTEDVDLLVTRAGLKMLHESLVGRGYVRVFPGSKNIRDANTKVKIEFVLTGDYPGSGKPQPISFPDPTEVAFVVNDGIRYVDLVSLVELKLASGKSGGADRAKDLVDVQRLIEIHRLDRATAQTLHADVQEKYEEIWDGLHAGQKRYIQIWRDKFLTLGAKSIDDMIDAMSAAADQLRQMKADGVTLDPQGGTGDDYARLVTSDRVVAEKWDMHLESEFFGDEE